MLENIITLSLQITFILFTLGVVHMTGSVLGGLGIISDLFVVIGAIQAGRFFINEDLRYDVSEFLGEMLDLRDVGAEIAERIDEVTGPDFEEIDDEDLSNVFKSMFFVGGDNLEGNPIVQTEEEEILEERKI